MITLCISAIASNQGKTILTTALLYHFRTSVRPYKIGPDFIDPQFHKKVCGTDSINLDSFIMNEKQIEWLYYHYRDKEVAILEGVMGFYDGQNKGCSTYSITKLLQMSSGTLQPMYSTLCLKSGLKRMSLQETLRV
jgi:cobyrinic acid a,c-diamide synthase